MTIGNGIVDSEELVQPLLGLEIPNDVQPVV